MSMAFRWAVNLPQMALEIVPFSAKSWVPFLQWPHNMVGDELLGLGLFIGIDS